MLKNWRNTGTITDGMEIWYVMDKRSGNASDEDDNSIYDVLTQAKNKKSKRII